MPPFCFGGRTTGMTIEPVPRAYFSTARLGLDIGALPDNPPGARGQRRMVRMEDEAEFEYQKMKDFLHFMLSDISTLRVCRPTSSP